MIFSVPACTSLLTENRPDFHAFRTQNPDGSVIAYSVFLLLRLPISIIAVIAEITTMPASVLIGIASPVPVSLPLPDPVSPGAAGSPGIFSHCA